MQAVKSVFRGVGHYVPPRVVTNNDLSALMDTSNEWIIERTGIQERRFVEPEVRTSDLAVEATKAVLDRTGLSAKDIDFIVAATLSPDFFFPGIGTILQHRMGMSHVPALDIRAQCSGFVYGTATADALIRAGQAKRILLVCAEVQSKSLDLTTAGRDMAVLFGDGAAATIIEAQPDNGDRRAMLSDRNARGVIDSILGSDGSGAEVLYMRAPGSATEGFVRHEDIDAKNIRPRMEGRTVFKNAVTRMSECVNTLLERNGVSPADVALFFPHQANMRINEFLREKLGLPKEKVFNNIERYGNTTAATIPLCLSEAEQQGRLKQGDLIVSVAFGAGFTWGANLIRW
jgi:3-oxoacyl-[acyl-carrier-protein] synthase-3